MSRIGLLILLISIVQSSVLKSDHKAQDSAYYSKNSLCYYSSWATYRPYGGQFGPQQMPANLCTHLVYCFAGLDEYSFQIKSLDPWNDLPDGGGKDGYNKFTNLCQMNPGLKCLLAIGGWNEGSTKYSYMANNANYRSAFVQSSVSFLQRYGFDGLDMDWEYPTQRGGSPMDKQGYIQLLQDLRQEFDKYNLTLTAAVSGNKDIIDSSYDVPEMSKSLDLINLMTYDYHGTWEPFTGVNSPLYPLPTETSYNQMLNVNFTVNYWLQLGAPAQKLIVSIPTYGHNYRLADPNQHGPGAPTTGPGPAGPYTQTPGTLGYNEIRLKLTGSTGWTIVHDQYYKAPYAYNGFEWMSYDDEQSVADKCSFINGLQLGGASVFSSDTDDFQPSDGSAKFPLTSDVYKYCLGKN